MRYLIFTYLLLQSTYICADPLIVEKPTKTITTIAQVNTHQPLQRDVDVVPKLLNVSLGLLLILTLIGVAAWAVRRFGRFHVAAKGHLKIVGGMHLGTRERVVLVQVGEKQILLGVTPGRIENLHTLDEPIPIDQDSTETNERNFLKFSSLLRSR